ncbi:hypothetical protein QUF80_23730 [Desulfococcaceae bacterium HSG8]|nr:hypothetical protein [Desulfococcaceae bacterium HSG8]
MQARTCRTPPLADAGPDQPADPEQPIYGDDVVTLDGSGSHDPDEIMSYRWTQTEGPSVTLSDSTAVTTTFIAPSTEGEDVIFKFHLTVKDPGGFYNSDEVSIAVSESPEKVDRDEGQCFINAVKPRNPEPGTQNLKRIAGLCFLLASLFIVRRRIRRFFTLHTSHFTLHTSCLLILILSSSPAFGGYFSVGGGLGGSADNYNVTLEAGATEIEIGTRKYFAGVGIPIIPHGYDNIPSDTLEESCPHSECFSAGEESEGSELGIFARAGIEAIYPGMYLSGLLGFTRGTEVKIARSPHTEWLYEESSEKKNYLMYGAGVTYFKEVLDDWQLCFQLDLDNRRGVTASIGFYW